MEIFQIVHIPTGEFLASKNRHGKAVLFANEASAKRMIANIVMHVPYVQGAPLSDYSIGSIEVTQSFCTEEFECIPLRATTPTYPAPRLLSLS